MDKIMWLYFLASLPGALWPGTRLDHSYGHIIPMAIIINEMFTTSLVAAVHKVNYSYGHNYK